MKKIFVFLLVASATITFAQQQNTPVASQQNGVKIKPETAQSDSPKNDSSNGKKNLILTPDQALKMKELQEKHIAVMEIIKSNTDKEKKLNDLQKEKENYMVEIQKILTPEQYEKWKSIKNLESHKKIE